MANLLMFNITHKIFHQFFHTCHVYKNFLLLPFYIAFSDLDFGWGHKISSKQSLLASFSCKTFQRIRIKCDLVLKQFKFNNLMVKAQNYSYQNDHNG